jgi:hypothetical protein
VKPQHFAFLAGSLLLIALALLLSGEPQTNPAGKDATPPDRVITITGEGEVRVKPDLAQVSVGVWTHGASATDAEALNLAFVKQVQAAMISAGADSDTLELVKAAVTTATYQDYTGATRISGFESRTVIRASVRNPSKVQAVVDSALTAGATSLEAVAFTLENPEPAKESAMRAALANARVRAAALLKADGEKLGDMRTMEVTAAETPPPASQSAGSLVFKALVKATFGY